MTIDNQENLIINIHDKTQCISKDELKKILENVLEEPKTFCANYERDNVEEIKFKEWSKKDYFEKIDPVVEQVRNDLFERSRKGIKKYGTTLADNKLELGEWLQHAYEECLDQANYLKSAILKLKENGN